MAWSVQKALSSVIPRSAATKNLATVRGFLENPGQVPPYFSHRNNGLQGLSYRARVCLSFAPVRAEARDVERKE